MPATKATDKISDEARAIMHRGFAAGWTVTRIVQAITDQTGESLATRTVARRAQEWRAEVARRQEAREQIDMIIASAKEHGLDPVATIQALAYQQVLDHPESVMGADPIELQTLNLKAEELRIKRRQLAVRERGLAVVERRLKMLEDKEQRALAALQDTKEEISPEERIRKIKEIYGLAA